MFLPLIINPILNLIFVIIWFAIVTIFFVKALKRLNTNEKTAFLLFAVAAFVLLGCIGYTIITGICTIYKSKSNN